MKTCKACNKEVEIEHFNYQSRKKGILRPYCKYCDRARAKKDYLNNREARLAHMKEWMKANNYKAPGNYKVNTIKGVNGMFRDGGCH